MSTIINATTTNGVVIQPDNSGSLVLQTNSGTTALTIDTSQNVLVGYSTLPTYPGKLNVNGNISWGDQSGKGRIYSDVNWTCILQGSRATGNMLFQNGADTSLMQLSSALGTGTVYSSSGVLTNTNPSDATLKTNIQNIEFGLDFIVNLRPVSFNLKDNVGSQGKQYGFIAQEVQQINDKIVKEFDYYPPSKDIDNPIPPEKKLGIEEKAIYTAMVKAIQEQQTIINDLKARIETLETK